MSSGEGVTDFGVTQLFSAVAVQNLFLACAQSFFKTCHVLTSNMLSFSVSK